jgi:hypothetical protein
MYRLDLSHDARRFWNIDIHFSSFGRVTAARSIARRDRYCERAGHVIDEFE